MKRLSILLLIIPMLVGCGKLEGTKDKILGTWYENFLDRTDCNSMYTFNSDGTRYLLLHFKSKWNGLSK